MALWPEIGSHIVLDLPPTAGLGEWSESRLMLAINKGQLHVWAYREGRKLLAVLTTVLTGDAITGSKCLLIYTASGVDALGLADWRSIRQTLATQAALVGADRIIGYTNDERVAALVERLGGSVATRLCEIKLEDS